MARPSITDRIVRPASPRQHTSDDDCAPYLRDDQCTACGVSHTAACACGGRGYHRPGCLEIDADPE